MKYFLRFSMVFLGIWLASPASMQAQVTMMEGRVNPDSSMNADWYLNQRTEKAWTKKNGDWEEVLGYVVKLIDYHGIIVLKHRAAFAIATQSGNLLRSSIGTYEYRNGIIQINDNANVYFYRDSICIGTSCLFDPEMVGGTTVYCATPMILGDDWHCYDVHGWGMMRLDGTWMIEPKFDRSFSFRWGDAEVFYYGQKRKINEKGEFVDSLDRRSQ